MNTNAEVDRYTVPKHARIPVEYMDRRGGNSHKLNDKVQVEKWLHEHKIPFETLEHKPGEKKLLFTGNFCGAKPVKTVLYIERKKNRLNFLLL